jgi:hypothetical protein
MPLLDHFRPPLEALRPWSGFHSAWASSIAACLNRGLLPPRFSAIPNLQLSGGTIEIDVATIREDGWQGPMDGETAIWSPPRPAGVVTVDFAGLDAFEVLVHYDDGEVRLVAAIELVSLANKDRPSTRRAFAMKCANYLEQGISVIVVDIVTRRHANLHEDLLGLLDRGSDQVWTTSTGLYAVAYRSLRANGNREITWWPETLTVGDVLPQMPLWIGLDICVRLDLEKTYMATCVDLRIKPEASGKAG